MTVDVMGVSYANKDCFVAALLAMTVDVMGVSYAHKDCFVAPLLAMTVDLRRFVNAQNKSRLRVGHCEEHATKKPLSVTTI
jgi:hypothetical protein